MLHTVAIVPREVVGKNGMEAWLEIRQLAKDCLLFAHKLLDTLEVDLKLRIRSVGVDYHLDRLRLFGAGQARYLKRFQDKVT